ncbi:aminoglycoside 6-adenylyltransferase [Paenibacillus kobensis]|uniref:aminoglycoside 6-adenylyltransferase n=1 Tax=Paenibacillus kobensis TaxID=59841 RepID=UPI000FDB661F|nr:aminoglycoside 6-adenylyltransferase [Paenibacillus kobensis]
MRSEREMKGLILGCAEEQENIRAVILNGSRVDAGARRDIFQDYDVIYVVTNVDPLVSDRSWIDRFGERIIMQMPDLMDDPDRTTWDKFTFLMQLADGNRIDLTLRAADQMAGYVHESLSEVLLDKDGTVGPLPPPSIADHLTKPPTAVQFANCCNEFWWVSTYVAKGLWRHELPYAMYMLDHPVRDMLVRMLQWHIGIQTGFTADSGKCGKYFERYLEPRHWESFAATYSDADYDNIWNALLTMGDLFRDAATDVAEHCGYSYPIEDDRRVWSHLQHVRFLPQDAEGVY